MTILQKLPQSGAGHAARGWHRFGGGDQAVRYTEAWEHETFAEEQARWERDDPEYAQICEQVRQAKDRGEEASRRADQAKAEWDARVATGRRANDDAQRAHHAFDNRPGGQTPAGDLADLVPATEESFPEENSDAAPRGGREAPPLWSRGPAARNPGNNEPTKLEVE
jgi:hypothetical protein